MAEAEQLIPPPPEKQVEESVEKEVVKEEVKVAEETAAAVTTDDPKVEKAEEEGVAASETPSTEGTPSFKEESYKVGDLKEWEKKALEAFRLKVEEAIKGKTIYKKEKAAAPVAAPVLVPAAEAGLESKEEEAGGAAEESKEEEKIETAEKSEEKVEKEEGQKDDEGIPIEEKKTEEVIKEREVEMAPKAVVAEAVAVEAEAPASPVPEGPKEFYLWDVPIHAPADERTDVVLLKFLRARDFKVEAALGMLKSAVAWRRDLGLDVTKAASEATATGEATPVAAEGAVLSPEEEAEFASLAYLHGTGREGHPVCYNEYGALQSKAFYGDAAKVGRFLRWRIGMLERTITSSLDFTPGGIHSMIQVIDLKHSPVFSKGRHVTSKALTLFQANYPELVHKQIILNIPWYSAFLSWYAAFGRQLTPRMQRKVVLVRPGKTAETLFKYISPDQVPVKYGGLSRQGDTEFEGVEAPVTEGVIKPGAKQTIELSVEAGWTLVWDVGVVGWDVVYGEEFSPSDEKSYAVIISKAKKVSPGADPIRNSFKAPEPGKIVITIDNSTSKKKKIVVYRSTTKKTIRVA